MSTVRITISGGKILEQMQMVNDKVEEKIDPFQSVSVEGRNMKDEGDSIQ